jgi:hypothetical protein
MKRSARGNGRVICAVSIWTLSLKRLDYSKRFDSKDPAKFIIRCPFEAEHSRTEDKGTAAWSPHDEKWPAFNCFHTHCSGRRTLDFLEQIEKDHPGIVDKHCAEKWTYEKGSSDRHGRVKVNLPQPDEQEKGEFVNDVAKESRICVDGKS